LPTHIHLCLVEKKQLTQSVYSYSFETEKQEELSIIPGQFATFVINPSVRRSYSFSSWKAPQRSIDFVVDTAPGGPGSKYFLALECGAISEIIAPLGHFQMQQTPVKKFYVATGTGIAPFRAMIDFLLYEHSQRRQIPAIQLYWGLRTRSDIYWKEYLHMAQSVLPQFSYDIILSRELSGGEWDGKCGHVTEFVLKNAHNSLDAEFYLCGNGRMISEVEKHLLTMGVSEKNMRKDVYFV